MAISWEKIPEEVRSEIRSVEAFTKRTNREASLSFCRRPGREKVFIAGYQEGDMNATSVEDCREELGVSDKIGDLHTHPVLLDTIGILPSPADIAGNIEDSFYTRSKQIGCRTNHHVPYIHCMAPKEVPDKKMVNDYDDAADESASLAQATKRGHLVDSFLLENVGKDFDYAMFDRKTWKRVHRPPPEMVVKMGTGTGGLYIRRAIHEMSRGVFCDYMQDLTVPSDDRVGQECRKELETRKFLGVKYEEKIPKFFLPDTPSKTKRTCVVSRARP